VVREVANCALSTTLVVSSPLLASPGRLMWQGYEAPSVATCSLVQENLISTSECIVKYIGKMFILQGNF